MEKLLQFVSSRNIVPLLDETLLSKLASEVITNYEDDDQAREKWVKSMNDGLDLVRQDCEAKNDPWDGAANVKFPLILIAALQFNARAYSALFPGDDIVKAYVYGFDATGEKADKGERISKHMSFQILEEMQDWEDGMDRLLFGLPILGCMFKKVFYDDVSGINKSDLIYPIDLVVPMKATSIEKSPRISHRFFMTPREIIEWQREGRFIEFDIDVNDVDKEEPQEIIEQHLYYDFDGDGYKEPYLCVVHKKSQKIVRILPRYGKDEILVGTNFGVMSLSDIEIAISQYEQTVTAIHLGGLPTPGQMPTPPQMTGGVIKINAINYFIKYGFLPSPDGTFYDWGFSHFLTNLGETINTALNQMLDAGTLSNLQCGFYDQDMYTKSGSISMKPGEFKAVRLNSGERIGDKIYQLQFPGPATALFNLMSFLVGAASDITSVKDIMTGETKSVEQPTTVMARIEQGLQQFGVIYRRVLRVLKKEFKLLYLLNGKYLSLNEYFKALDSEKILQIGRTDYQDNEIDVVPVADPAIASKAQKLQRAQALLQFANDPGCNTEEIKRRYFDALDIKGVDAIIIPEEQVQTPPSPELITAQAKMVEAEANLIEKSAHAIERYTSAIHNMALAEAEEVGQQLDMYKVKLDALKAHYEGTFKGRVGAVGNGQGDNKSLEQFTPEVAEENGADALPS